MHRKDIEIQRNVIERFLMKIRAFFMENRRAVLIGVASFLSACFLIIVGIILHAKVESSDLYAYEQILNKYNLTTEHSSEDNEKMKKMAAELKDLIDSSYWGYINENGNYILADIYFSLKDYEKAKDHLIKFADDSPSSFFAPLALVKAAIAYENLGKKEEAFSLFKRLEMEYNESIIADEIYYNLARLYQERSEIFKAKEYYNKVVSLYPRSSFAAKARNRILMLGYLKNKNK